MQMKAKTTKAKTVKKRGINYTFLCGCITARRHKNCPTCGKHLIAESSVENEEKFMGKVLVSKKFSAVIDCLPKKTDLILIRGELSPKKRKLFKQIKKNFPEAILVYQSFSVTSGDSVLSYFLSVGYPDVSYMADLCKADPILGTDRSSVEVGRLYLFNAGNLNLKSFPKSPVNIEVEDYIYHILKALKVKRPSSVHDCNGRLDEACRRLKLNSFTHTTLPLLGAKMDREQNNFKPNKSKKP